MQNGLTASTKETKSNEDLPRDEVLPNLPTKFKIPKRRVLLIVLFLIVFICAGVASIPLVEEFMSHVETENAYLTGHVHSISPRIEGTVKEVLVEDNQLVRAGDVLVVLDDRDELIELRKAKAHMLKLAHDVAVSNKVVSYASSNASAANKAAEASIDTAISTVAKDKQFVSEAKVGISVSEQLLAQRDAELHKADLDLKRFSALEKAGAVSREELDSAKRNFDVADAAKKAATESLEQAKSRFKQAQSQVGIAKAQLVAARAAALEARAANDQVSVNSSQKVSSEAAVQEAQVEVDKARLMLSYTVIKAPIDGRIGRKSVEVGQRVQPGSPLLAVVSEEKWIVANFKETQLLKGGNSSSRQ